MSVHTMTSASSKAAPYKLVTMRRQNCRKGSAVEARTPARLYDMEARVMARVSHRHVGIMDGR